MRNFFHTKPLTKPKNSLENLNFQNFAQIVKIDFKQRFRAFYSKTHIFWLSSETISSHTGFWRFRPSRNLLGCVRGFL